MKQEELHYADSLDLNSMRRIKAPVGSGRDILRFGCWCVDTEGGITKTRPFCDFPYSFSPQQIEESRLLEHIQHLRGKKWFTPEMEHDFISAYHEALFLNGMNNGCESQCFNQGQGQPSIIVHTEHDYSKFKFLETNRNVKEGKGYLRKSIQRMDLTMYVPILVDKDFNILDGQHRFCVCRDLGKPVSYIVYEGGYKADDVIVALNTNARNWRQEEWIEHYAKIGVESYVKFMKMSELFNLGISNNILTFSNTRSSSMDVKRGNLIDDSSLMQPVYEFITEIEHPNKTYRPFVHGLLLFLRDNLNDKKKIERLKKKIIAVPCYSKADDYYLAFRNMAGK